MKNDILPHVLHWSTSHINAASVLWWTLCLSCTLVCCTAGSALLWQCAAFCHLSQCHRSCWHCMNVDPAKVEQPPHLEWPFFFYSYKLKKKKMNCFPQFWSHIAVVKLLWLSQWLIGFTTLDCKDYLICKGMTSLWSLPTSECLGAGAKCLLKRAAWFCTIKVQTFHLILSFVFKFVSI